MTRKVELCANIMQEQEQPWAKTIKKNTNSTQNKSQTHRAKQYEVTSFLSTDCGLSTETCSKNVYSLGPLYSYSPQCRAVGRGTHPASEARPLASRGSCSWGRRPAWSCGTGRGVLGRALSRTACCRAARGCAPAVAAGPTSSVDGASNRSFRSRSS